MTMQAISEPAAKLRQVREQELDRYGTPRVDIDPIRGGMSNYTDFGGAFAATDVVVLATAAPGATRGRIVAIYIYNTVLTTTVIRDGAGGSQIFPTIYAGAQGTIAITKDQLGEGGIIFTSSVNVTPSAVNEQIWIDWIPEYDTDD